MAVRFKVGMRVKVIRPMGVKSSIEGQMGGVVRPLRRSQEEAWVEMDCDLPIDLRSFPVDDERARHICLFDDEVEEAK